MKIRSYTKFHKLWTEIVKEIEAREAEYEKEIQRLRKLVIKLGGNPDADTIDKQQG